MSFTDEEISYLYANPLARLASLCAGEQPDVVPVALEFDGARFWVGGPRPEVLATRKFRNVGHGRDKVAFVVDEMISVQPFIARGIRVYGVADGPVERVGMVGPGHYLRITPALSWSWNLSDPPLPAGDTWYPMRRAEHRIP
ncbi:MAG: PPOX class F420-dependent oxidoreductase [Streptomyces sp.]|nr:PPOX class F420-dependent oxidoreductase [Streptomyces sp.]NUT28468.1 PPOX class F420-dependent oxidoreductase [Streptomyces sp.]